MTNAFTNMVTPKGILSYVYLDRTETYNGQDTGKYAVSIQFEADDTEELINFLTKEWEHALSSNPDFHNVRPKRGTTPNLGFREDKNGNILFKAKTNATIKTKTGDILQKTIPIFDAHCKPMTATDIGYGSEARLSLSISPYFANASNYGVCLYLNGVQILNLKKKGSSDASSLGFAEETGYSVAEENTTEDIPVPFVPDGEEVENEF